jgi:copper(I)-binding protein
MKLKLSFLIALLALGCGSLHAQAIEVRDAWARAVVPGQRATGAYMKITAKDGATLVAVASSMAGVAELHEMKLEGSVMKMRPVPALDLPAGKMVELKPGGYHVMLMDLKGQLKKDSTIPLTLTFKDAKGVQSKVELKVPVATVAPGAKPAGMAEHDHGMKH